MNVISKETLLKETSPTFFPSGNISKDGSTIVIRTEEWSGGIKLYPIYIRKRNKDGFFDAPQKIYAPAYDFIFPYLTLISNDGETLFWLEHGASDRGYVIKNISSRNWAPMLVFTARQLGSSNISMSGDGNWIYVWTFDARQGIEDTGLKDITLVSHYEGEKWSKPIPLTVDGQIIHSSVNDSNFDGSIIQIARKVARWNGEEYITKSDFTIPEETISNIRLSNDGNTLVFTSAKQVPNVPVSDQVFDQAYPPIPIRSLVVIHFEESKPMEVKTTIVDQGYGISYHFSKRTNKLIWTLQRELPTPDDPLMVEQWPKH